MATTINFTDFTDNVATSTDNVVTGNGVFDDMMETINAHIEAQFQKDRITGKEYATVYLGAMQSAMAQSMQFVLQKPISERQADLVTRQTAGFDDDAKQKLLKNVMDTWAVAYSVAPDAANMLDAVKPDAADSILKDALTSLGVNISTNALGL